MPRHVALEIVHRIIVCCLVSTNGVEIVFEFVDKNTQVKLILRIDRVSGTNLKSICDGGGVFSFSSFA